MNPQIINQLTGYKKQRFALAQGCLVLSLFLVITASGCKKFLDVPVRNQVPQTDLFADEQGFMDALTGVYIGLDKPNNGGSQGLYTSDLTMGTVSVMANTYTNAVSSGSLSNGIYVNANIYNYTDAGLKAEITGIWNGMYNEIAAANNILQQVDSKQSIFTTDDYYRVKGESLALRGLLHFDLARLFGQPPLTGANTNAIPYVTAMGVAPTTFSTLNNALNLCIADLQTAQSILAHTDTSVITQGSQNLFKGFTQNHMNYWATEALLARVYLYKGDTVNAMKYAKAVIGSGKFPLITGNVAAATNMHRDRLFSNELVFAVYSTNITNNNYALFGANTSALTINAAAKTALYTTTTGSANDYRYTSWFDNNAAGLNVPSKYFQDVAAPYAWQNEVPVIRISEMYYIVAECAGRSGDVATGLSYLNKVRVSRGLTALTTTNVPNAATLSNELMKEHQKEFIQEGQTFFYYKRLNLNLSLVAGASTFPAGAYVFPIPDQEVQYNHQ